jgi:hypothetical protein
MMRLSFLSALAALLLMSCGQDDKFTGIWNKDYNTTTDATAFPNWKKSAKLVDNNFIRTPLIIRIKKDLGVYVLNCYQFDGASRSVVRDALIFDYVKFNKIDDNTLLSDNAASKMMTDKRITLHIDPVTRQITMDFPLDKTEMPQDKRVRELFKSMFSSGYHKILDVRRRTNEEKIITEKLRESNIIFN